MNLAVIPARGQSKRIPKKNVRLFLGKPIMAYSIEAAIASECFDEIIVSTDTPEIADIAQRYGATVPFLRPPELSDDHTATLPVVQHAVTYCQGRGPAVDNVCCIYATAPFITADVIRLGLARLEQAASEYAFSVTRYPFPIQRAVRVTRAGRLEAFHPELVEVRSQDLEEAYHDAGQFYWGRAGAFLNGVPLFSDASVPVVVPGSRVQDIDTEEDWREAELKYQLVCQSGE